MKHSCCTTVQSWHTTAVVAYNGSSRITITNLWSQLQPHSPRQYPSAPAPSTQVILLCDPVLYVSVACFWCISAAKYPSSPGKH